MLWAHDVENMNPAALPINIADTVPNKALSGNGGHPPAKPPAVALLSLVRRIAELLYGLWLFTLGDVLHRFNTSGWARNSSYTVSNSTTVSLTGMAANWNGNKCVTGSWINKVCGAAWKSSYPVSKFHKRKEKHYVTNGEEGSVR